MTVELVFAEAEVKKLTAEFKSTVCVIKPAPGAFFHLNCLGAFLSAPRDEQSAYEKGLCSGCKVALQLIEDRKAAKKRLSLAKAAIMRAARANGKAVIANDKLSDPLEPTSEFYKVKPNKADQYVNLLALAQTPVSATIN
jgi:hypothetical protein